MDSNGKIDNTGILNSPINNTKVEINHYNDYALSGYVGPQRIKVTPNKIVEKGAMNVLANEAEKFNN